MGATTVLMAAELGLPENIHGIISDCGFTSVHDIWKHVANKNLHLTYGIHQIPLCIQHSVPDEIV